MGTPSAMSAGAFGFVMVIYLAIAALIITVYWKIASKAGYPGWYALGMLVPCLNLILMLAFAFTEWPIEKELNYLRSLQGHQQGYPRYPGQTP